MNSRAGMNTLSHKSGSLRYTLHKKANETLEKDGIALAVICPEDVDPNEWIAVHAIDFYNDVSILYGVVQEECTRYSCPIMSAGETYEFLWSDKYKYRKPTRLHAKMYIEILMNWIVSLLEDETLFPVDAVTPFPRDYREQVKRIFRRMFRVYAHIYYSHMTLINRVGLGNQFQFSLTHFVFFVDQFRLVGPGDLRPLKDLINQLAPTLSLTKAMNALCEKQEHLQLTGSTPGSRLPSQQQSSSSSSQQSDPSCHSVQSHSSQTGQTAQPAQSAPLAQPAHPTALAPQRKEGQAGLVYPGQMAFLGARLGIPSEPAAFGAKGRGASRSQEFESQASLVSSQHSQHSQHSQYSQLSQLSQNSQVTHPTELPAASQNEGMKMHPFSAYVGEVEPSMHKMLQAKEGEEARGAEGGKEEVLQPRLDIIDGEDENKCDCVVL